MDNAAGVVSISLSPGPPCHPGWKLMLTGAVFGYFELLFKSRDLNTVVQEEVRLRSHEQTMRSAGIDYDIIIDMFDYTWELFDAIKAALERGDNSEIVLLQSLNDENVSNSIVYHFKVSMRSKPQSQCADVSR
jgi:hypothetical protein